MRGYKTYTPEELTRWIRAMEARGDYRHHAFYSTHAWRHLRDDVLDDQHHECQVCRARGDYTTATTAHHLKTVRQAPWLALTKDNLIAVCDDCHYKIHHPEEKWQDEKW